MILSTRLANLYATYRNRFINGPGAVFCTPDPMNPQVTCTPPVGCRDFPDVPYQQSGQKVQFLRQSTTNVTQPGAFLVADKLSVNKPTTNAEGVSEELWPVAGITHGDQTFYASNLLLALVAEYVISFDENTLGFIESVLATFRRLASWQPGYKEEGETPATRCIPTGSVYGYTLRHDAFDGSEESFCNWYGNKTLRYLEPSYDQLGALNNCGAFAYSILTNPDVKSDPDCPATHKARIDAIKADIIERMTTTHRYVATLSKYNMRRCDALEVDRGGGACWMYAYPLARVQGWVRGSGPDDYHQFLEIFVWSFFADLGEFFIDQILDGLAKGLTSIQSEITHVRDLIQKKLKTEFGHFLDVATKYFGDLLEGVYGGAVDLWRSVVQGVVSSPIGTYLRNLISSIPTDSIWSGLNEAVAVSLFQIFSRATLVDPRSEVHPKDSFVLNVGADLLLQGISGLPSTLDFTYTTELKTPPVTVRGVTIIPAKDYGQLKVDFSISVPWATIFEGMLLEYTVAAELLGEIAFSNTDALRFMSYHFFASNAAGHTFDVCAIDGVKAALRYDNAFFMALMHRFYGKSGADAMQQLQNLETAPDTFPKSNAPRGWNQDFRWERGKSDPDDPGKLYNGLDLMVATMVAASLDAAANRAPLIDAINAATNPASDEPPGVVSLPFEGPYVAGVDAWNIWDASFPALRSRTPVYVGVTFERRDPAGGVKLRVLAEDGTTTDHFFQQGQPGRAIQFPPTIQVITILEIGSGTKGSILIGE